MTEKNQKNDFAIAPFYVSELKRRSQRTGRKLRLKKAPRPKSIKPIERRYFGMLLDMLSFADSIVQSKLVAVLQQIIGVAEYERPRADSVSVARADDYASEINQTIQESKIQFFGTYTDQNIEAMANEQAALVNAHNLQNFKNIFKTVLGIDYIAFEGWRENEVNAFVRNNVSYIKSIPSQYFERIEQTVTTSVQQGLLARDIIPQIRQIYNVSENRAALIAVDQTNKFNGALNKLRQTGVGVKSYIWRTSKDERVRATHRTFEGQEYTWAKGSPEGHPGQPIRCRCYSSPVFDPESEF